MSGSYRENWRDQRARGGVLLVMLSLCCSAPAVSTEPVSIDEPFSIFLVTQDRRQVIGSLVRYSDKAFIYKDASGTEIEQPWSKLKFEDQMRLHERLLKPEEKEKWDAFAQRLRAQPGGESWAKKVLKRTEPKPPPPPEPVRSGQGGVIKSVPPPATGPGSLEPILSEFAPPRNFSKYIMDLAEDKLGRVWFATEDKGVWCYDARLPRQEQWVNFTASSTLGSLADDHIYALAIDHEGRVWAGHLNQGVSVYNGSVWKNYSVVDGPIGERVYDIAVAPLAEQGDAPESEVWIATDAGLTRYSSEQGSWTDFTRADGLPADQIKTLEFDPAGRLYAGSFCHGLLIADPEDGYTQWRQVTAPYEPHRFPLTPTGRGLPSNLINDILVTEAGTLYVATDHGVARSTDRGDSWTFLRGRNWAGMIRGLVIETEPRGKMEHEQMFLEDYTTCLAEDIDGNLWVGHWEHGYSMYPPGGVEPTHTLNVKRYCYTILPTSGLGVLIGHYGSSLDVIDLHEDEEDHVAAGPAVDIFPKLIKHPDPRRVLDEQQWQASIKELLKFSTQQPSPHGSVAFMGEDWTTRGDWLGRYGTYWAKINAICAPRDYDWGAGEHRVQARGRIGPMRDKTDSIRYWVWRLYTNEQRVLELPPTYLDSRIQKGLTTADKNRRPAGVDDHAEVYPWTMEGPDLWYSLTIPEGSFRLSLYFVNYDGRVRNNRFRDYVVRVKADRNGKPGKDLAIARVRDWWGGVYKQFVVSGGQKIHVQVAKNNTFNTMLMGIMLDQFEDRPDPYFASGDRLGAQAFSVDQSSAARAFRLLDSIRVTNPHWWAMHSRPYYLEILRSAGRATETGGKTHPAYLSAVYRFLDLNLHWEVELRRQGLTPAREIEKALKWNGKTFSNQNRGRELVLQYLREQKESGE